MNEGQTKPLKKRLTVEEAAAYLNISPRTIYNGICRKAKRPFPIRVRRIGRLCRFHIDDLARNIDSL
jgi:excisionase family DNA binding protein